ncbi:MAG: glycoside hydrolase family 88 protein [Treponema sp.]|nr:glycoside hydrolase family 88 protein [Treponema sp.]
MLVLGKDILSLDISLSVQKMFKPEQFIWHYEHGLLLQSVYAVSKIYNRLDLQQWVQSVYDGFITPDGDIKTYKKEEYNLDQINPGKYFFDAFKETHNQKYKKALDVLYLQLQNQPRTQTGGFWHKKIYPWQMWLDGLYMASPFYARYIAEFGDKSDFDDVVHQLELVYTHTLDERTGLLYHAWDESCKQLWADRDTGMSPHVWGRAMGWYCMAVVDVLDWVGDVPPYARKKLLLLVQRLIRPILDFQDAATGLWYQVLDVGSKNANYLETSVSAMFVYFLYKIVRTHCIDSRKSDLIQSVLAAADKGLQGLSTRFTRGEDGLLHLTGTCSGAGLGGNPYRDGSFQYYISEKQRVDDFKGLATAILASLEFEIRSGEIK